MKSIFITGGARSGKSRFAEKEALKRSGKVVYIATAQALDEEMAHRIRIHKITSFYCFSLLHITNVVCCSILLL